MSDKVRVIVLRTAGTNCDKETAFAFREAGAAAELVHINELGTGERRMSDYSILAIPGGFTYGDDITSGKILANELKFRLEDELEEFIKAGRLIIGICNGFQVLVKAGLLPNITGCFGTVETTLTLNDSAKFEDRWVYLKKLQSKCIWTKGIDKTIFLPVAHGEGKFIPKDRATLKALKDNGMVALEYTTAKGGKTGYPDNPNGSVDNIAGICDPSGRIFGLMPHPERHINRYQHPFWTRATNKDGGDGLKIFQNGVRFAKNSL